MTKVEEDTVGERKLAKKIDLPVEVVMTLKEEKA